MRSFTQWRAFFKNGVVKQVKILYKSLVRVSICCLLGAFGVQFSTVFLKFWGVFALLTLSGDVFSTPSAKLCRTVVVQQAWMRPAMEGGNAGVFMNIQTPACQDGDVLEKATCADATRVELHGHTQDAKGIFRMRPVSHIPVVGSVVLKPGGLHVMLMGLRRTFREGEFVRLRLYFKQAGPKDVKACVRQSVPHIQH